MPENFVLDREAILLRLGGDEEIFATLAELFLQDVDIYSAQLAAALAAGEPVGLQREAHTIKGLLATFADEEGATLARTLEQQAKLGDGSGLDEMVAAVQARLQLVASALRGGAN